MGLLVQGQTSTLGAELLPCHCVSRASRGFHVTFGPAIWCALGSTPSQPRYRSEVAWLDARSYHSPHVLVHNPSLNPPACT